MSGRGGIRGGNCGYAEFAHAFVHSESRGTPTLAKQCYEDQQQEPCIMTNNNKNNAKTKRSLV